MPYKIEAPKEGPPNFKFAADLYPDSSVPLDVRETQHLDGRRNFFSTATVKELDCMVALSVSLTTTGEINRFSIGFVDHREEIGSGINFSLEKTKKPKNRVPEITFLSGYTPCLRIGLTDDRERFYIFGGGVVTFYPVLEGHDRKREKTTIITPGQFFLLGKRVLKVRSPRDSNLVRVDLVVGEDDLDLGIFYIQTIRFPRPVMDYPWNKIREKILEAPYSAHSIARLIRTLGFSNTIRESTREEAKEISRFY